MKKMRHKQDTPVIFKYNDYRKYLRDLFNFHKNKNRHFTYRYIAMKAKFASPSALKDVVDGKKNLSQESVLPFLSC